MSDDKPSAFEDVRKGLGLLFRAARTTVERLPKKNLENVVMESAREVGRAFENVGKAIEREVLGHKEGEHPAPPSPPADATKDQAPPEPGRNQGNGPTPPPDAA
jgi:hypothetical protein